MLFYQYFLFLFIKLDQKKSAVKRRRCGVEFLSWVVSEVSKGNFPSKCSDGKLISVDINEVKIG